MAGNLDGKAFGLMDDADTLHLFTAHVIPPWPLGKLTISRSELNLRPSLVPWVSFSQTDTHVAVTLAGNDAVVKRIVPAHLLQQSLGARAWQSPRR